MRPAPFLALALLALLAGCGSLPDLAGRTQSQAIADTDAATTLGRAIAPQARAHPGRSGVVALADGRGAFAARALLADAAERSLDVQYYLWRTDLSGTLLAEALRRAAGRGVRVRLLLDDNNTGGTDALLAALDAHPNIEVRLFNPFVHRGLRALDYLLDFPRLNRRMHNKSFTADNQVTVVGGRNVGDSYFGADQAVLFTDLDVMAAGPVVREVSADFDRYWASASSYPLDRLLAPGAPAAWPPAADDGAQRADYLAAVARSPLVRELLDGTLEFEWARVQVVSDDPAKGLGRHARETQLPQRLREVIGTPARELQLVSAYFVPTDAGRDALVRLAGQGVRVSVLTNSLEATDVAVVHAGYARHRAALLRAGVALYELKGAPGTPPQAGLRFGGSSAASLHAKTFAVDGARVFVGSFNFDPRSARLNTEMGFVIDSPRLAQRVAGAFRGEIPRRAYEVRLDGEGGLEWVERTGQGQRVYRDEPLTSPWKRLALRLLSWLPIDWLL